MTTDELSQDNLMENYKKDLEDVNVIAHPMATKKLTKKLYKLIKKGLKIFSFMIPPCSYTF